MVAPGVFGKVKFNPARITAQANDANRITITAGGMVGLKILLPYQLVQLDAADLSVEVNNKVIHKGAIFPDIEATLKHVRQTGDRKRLVASRSPSQRFDQSMRSGDGSSCASAFALKCSLGSCG